MEGLGVDEVGEEEDGTVEAPDEDEDNGKNVDENDGDDEDGVDSTGPYPYASAMTRRPRAAVACALARTTLRVFASNAGVESSET